jgi:hypothetical protein
MYFWDGTNWVDARGSARPARRESRAANWTATALMLLVAALFVVPFSTTFAAQSSSSVWIETASGTRAAANSVHYGDAFAVGYTTRERQPWAHVVCYPNSSTQYASTNRDGSIWGMDYSVYPGGPSPQDFVAGQSVDGNWSAGGADCRVDLLKYSSGYTRSTVLATSRFTVMP